MTDYEMIIGLEVHVELNTKTKIFCSCPIAPFGAEPNTSICPVCMGLPGALPVLNRRAVEFALMAGLALHCDVGGSTRMDRKHYFYPDLPKAYQISQYDLPLCRAGYLDISLKDTVKRIGITRIHLEEDAGKLFHGDTESRIDGNRCGVPLIEIVSEPDLRSPEEAMAYLKKLHSVLRYTGISHCRMNEGAFRCDVNISVRPIGQTEFGIRTEIKNLNSFAFVGKAIAYEATRQIEVLQQGSPLLQETRRFDPSTGKTYTMRSKENAKDYRFFPEPDLPPFVVDNEMVDRLRRALPRLPDERQEHYVTTFGLSVYDSEVLTGERALSDYFEACAAHTHYPKILANLFLGDLLRIFPAESFPCPITPAHMGTLATLVGEEQIHYGTAKKLLTQMTTCDANPEELVREQDLYQIRDESVLRQAVNDAIADTPKAIEDYRKGKTKGAVGAIIGKAMTKTRGKAHPALLATLAEEELACLSFAKEQ